MTETGEGKELECRLVRKCPDRIVSRPGTLGQMCSPLQSFLSHMVSPPAHPGFMAGTLLNSGQLSCSQLEITASQVNQ